VAMTAGKAKVHGNLPQRKGRASAPAAGRWTCLVGKVMSACRR
jgi:hypothetical protein